MVGKAWENERGEGVREQGSGGRHGRAGQQLLSADFHSRSDGRHGALGISLETLVLPKVTHFCESSTIQTSSPCKPISSKCDRSGFYLCSI